MHHHTGKTMAALVATVAMIGSSSVVLESRVAAAEPPVATPAAPPQPAPAQQSLAAPKAPQAAWVSARQGLNLRAAATTENQRQGVLPYGAAVTLLNEVTGQDPYHTQQTLWYEVVDQGQKRYIWSGGVTLGTAPVVTPTALPKPKVSKVKVVKAKPAKVTRPGKPKRLKAPPRYAGTTGGGWAALRQCESGGNYAINTGNGYYGAYQFDLRTWRGVGGRGLPSQASPAEQDMRAQMLYQQRGRAPWPVCGRHL